MIDLITDVIMALQAFITVISLSVVFMIIAFGITLCIDKHADTI